ncbi:MAG TPA: hypothetical protein VLL25_02940, partial [Acidimicrobiales bacterium]|nr:hypothetical protein [Acidimicrobiales bacterium]
LVGSTSRGLFTIDIDHNRIDPLRLTGSPNLEVIQLVARQGFVVIRAFGSDGAGSPVDRLLAVSSTFTGPVTDLGALEALRPDVNVPDPRVIPGERPDTFWVRKPDGSAVEYDGTFRVVRGPVAMQPEDELRGATAAGLFVGIRAPSGQSFSLELIDPAQPTGPSRLVGTGVPLTTCGNQLIWFQNDDRGLMHVTDSVSGHDRTLDPGPNMRPDSEWTCSPDSTRVAGTWFSLSDTPRDVPGVVDLSTGQLALTTGGGLDTQPGATSIVWTPAGDRVFLLGALASGRGPDPMTFRPGDTDLIHLRLPGQILDAIVPLPS